MIAMSVASVRITERIQRRYDRSLVHVLVNRLREVGFATSITLFGAAFLLSALPFIVLISSFADRRVEDDLSHHLGLNEHASEIVGRLFAHSASRSTQAVVLALVLSVLGAAGVAGTLQKDYERIFGTIHHGAGNAMRLLIWGSGFCGWFILDALITAGTRHLPAGLLLDVCVGFIATFVFFWWTMRFLLAETVPWSRLRLPAALTAVLWILLEGIAALYFSTTITSDSKVYGTVGVVFSLLTWFIAIAAVILFGAVAGEVWHDRRAR